MHRNENPWPKPNNNETLGQRPNTEHGFSYSPLHKLNSQNVFFTILSCFFREKKSTTKLQFKNVYLPLNIYIPADTSKTEYNLD